MDGFYFSILDASFPNPKMKDVKQAHIDQRIPSAKFFDVMGLSDPERPGMIMLPHTDTFCEEMRKLDVRK
jgi:3-mercaptopyruvate sulfurtransferase SseA